MTEREAFQEIDFRRMFGPDRQMGGGDRRRAAHPRAGRARPFTARPPGRPGPVVLALPEDMLTDVRRGAPMPGPTSRPGRRPGRQNMARLRELLAAAQAAAS